MLTPVSFNSTTQPVFKGRLEGIDEAQKNIGHLGQLREDNLFDVLKLTHFMKTAGKALVEKLPRNDIVKFSFIQKTDEGNNEKTLKAVIKHTPEDKSKESQTISWNPKSYKPVNKFIEDFTGIVKQVNPEKFESWKKNYDSGKYNNNYITEGLKALIMNIN